MITVNRFRDVFMGKINMALKTDTQVLKSYFIHMQKITMALIEQHTSSQILFHSQKKNFFKYIFYIFFFPALID